MQELYCQWHIIEPQRIKFIKAHCQQHVFSNLRWYPTLINALPVSKMSFQVVFYLLNQMPYQYLQCHFYTVKCLTNIYDVISGGILHCQMPYQYLQCHFRWYPTLSNALLISTMSFQVVSYTVKCLTNIYNVRYNSIHCAANLLAGLAPYHVSHNFYWSNFVMGLVDFNTLRPEEHLKFQYWSMIATDFPSVLNDVSLYYNHVKYLIKIYSLQHCWIYLKKHENF